ncbi:ATP synthase F0 subunit 6 (mitochondrion) [Macrosteles quadrilineatus]|uniref:ATP synthase subunit a n=1 Tax=Macrosteles quadrilineatus TaxID=74068 RepID=A0A343CXA5_MACQU|nr:ATP synthase F0 subunit 6 [Macrosteles quadrilineatus]ARQ26987.1 ATP synthase F0 subunit 6 [Macrosteles quadrilineatus]
MMMNLFSVFDPSSGIMSLNWLSMLIMVLVTPTQYWNSPNKIIHMLIKLSITLMNEIIMHLKKYEQSIIFVSLFMYLLINNVMGLLPYIFTASSHLAFSLALALTIWMSMMLFGWMNKTNHMFSHLVPIGTPNILMPFMVVIESISNLIRPGSLAVRLTANMIAGHLLMSLLGNNLSGNFTLMMMMMMMFIILMMFELAVAFIQSYVFMTLSTLYSSEI